MVPGVAVKCVLTTLCTNLALVVESSPLPLPLPAVTVAATVADDVTADPAVETVNLAATELTAALVLLLLNKFLLPPSL